MSSFFANPPLDADDQEYVEQSLATIAANLVTSQANATDAQQYADAAEAAEAATTALLASIPGAGTSAWKEPVFTVGTEEVDVDVAPAAIGGATLMPGKRVLLTAQTTTSENAIWVFNGLEVPMTAADDYDDPTKKVDGTTVLVLAGASAGQLWRKTADTFASVEGLGSGSGTDAAEVTAEVTEARASADTLAARLAAMQAEITALTEALNSGSFANPTPEWVPNGASFALSAAENRIWTEEDGVSQSVLSPDGALYTAGTNGLALNGSGLAIAVSQAGPRRSWSVTDSAFGWATAYNLPQLANGALVPPAVLNLGLVFDIYVDGENGSDANGGTALAPVATLKRAEALANARPGDSNILVRFGTYTDDSMDYLGTNGATITVVFEPGCTLVSTFVGVGERSGIAAQATSTVRIFGNGLHVKNFQAVQELAEDDYLSTSNGVAAYSSARIYVYDTTVSDCGDCFTLHSDSHGEAYRCWFKGGEKFTVVHVNESTSYHEDCIIEGGSNSTYPDARPVTAIIGGLKEGGSSSELGDHRFVRCRILRSATTNTVGGDRVAVFESCQLGTWTEYLDLRHCTVIDSFVNVGVDLQYVTETWTRVFGKASIRMRQSTVATTGVIEDSVFVGGNNPFNNFLYTNFDGGQNFGTLLIEDSVFTGYTQVVDAETGTNGGAYWTGSSISLDSCTFFGNTDDFSASAEGSSQIVDPSTSDPGLGSYSGSMDMAEYAVTSGTDGFSASDVVAVGPPPDMDDVWRYTDLAALGLENGDAVRLTDVDDTETDITVSGGQLTIPSGHWAMIHGPV